MRNCLPLDLHVAPILGFAGLDGPSRLADRAQGTRSGHRAELDLVERVGHARDEPLDPEPSVGASRRLAGKTLERELS